MNRYRLHEDVNRNRVPLRVGDSIRLKQEFLEDYTQKSIIKQLSENRGLIISDQGDKWGVDWTHNSLPKNIPKYMVTHE